MQAEPNLSFFVIKQGKDAILSTKIAHTNEYSDVCANEEMCIATALLLVSGHN